MEQAELERGLHELVQVEQVEEWKVIPGEKNGIHKSNEVRMHTWVCDTGRLAGLEGLGK